MSLVASAIDGYHAAIRSLPLIEAKLLLIEQIKTVCGLYGNRQVVGEAIFIECREIILKKFAYIGVNEIREAYRANAAGELQTNGKGEMYGGEFNAANFTAIMAAYSEKRRKVIAAYTNALHEASEKEKSEARKEKQRREFEENFQNILKRVAEKAEDWQGCPEYLYHSCEKRGLINLTPDEKREIFKRAVDISKVQMQLKKDTAITLLEIREAANEKHEDRARGIARQIALWECVVMPMKMELI